MAKMNDHEDQIAIEVIIDNSGSMAPFKGKTVDGINEFIKQLSTAILPAHLGVTLFDDVLRTSLIDGVSVADQPQIEYTDYDPRHGTENIAHSVIQALDTRLAPLKARQKVLVVMTDGLNTSPQMATAKALVTKRQSEGWLIIWLGVYVEAYEASYKPTLLQYAKNLGIPAGLTYAFPTEKIDKGMPLAAQVALRFICTNSSKASEFTDQERKVFSKG
jgi:hypothetical protein